MLIYDLEIVNAIPDRKNSRVPGIKYCNGWEDHANMGVSVIGAYDTEEERFRVFTQEAFWEFAELAKKHTLIGFNSIHFDDQVLKHVGVNVASGYDVLQELWVAAGLSRTFEYPKNIGFGLNATALANGFTGKTGDGAHAPVDWQRGCYGSVIDYCLEDVRLTWKLVDQVLRVGGLRDPRDPEKWLQLAPIT